MKNVIAELKNEFALLLSQKEYDNFDEDFVHIKKLILGKVVKRNLIILN